jgi:hypothetical protein
VRSVDLAVYADALAAEAAALAARLERARRRLRQAAIEREARAALPPETIERLEALRLLEGEIGPPEVEEIADVQASLTALEALQAWVERELYVAREGSRTLAGSSPASTAAR